jgi:hypothetical protein
MNTYEAVQFALNYPTEVMDVEYDEDKDLYLVDVLDIGGIYTVNLTGSFIRACLNWEGEKAW